MSTDESTKKIFQRANRSSGLPFVTRVVDQETKRYLLSGSCFPGRLVSGGMSGWNVVPTILESTPDAFITTAENGYKYLGWFAADGTTAEKEEEKSFTSDRSFSLQVRRNDAYVPPNFNGSHFDYRKHQAERATEKTFEEIVETKTQEILGNGFGWVTGYSKEVEDIEPEEVVNRVCEDPGGSFCDSDWKIICRGSDGPASPYAYCDVTSSIREGLWSIFAEMAAGANVHGKLTIEVEFKITNAHGSAEYPETIDIPLTATVITMPVDTEITLPDGTVITLPKKFTNEIYPVGTKAEVAQTIDLGSVTVTQIEEGEYEGTLVIEDFVYQIPESKFVKVVIRDTMGPRAGVQEFCFDRPAVDKDYEFLSSVACNISPKYVFKQVGDTPQ